MNKVRKIYYAVCLYIWSTTSFADEFGCAITSLQKFIKYPSIIVLIGCVAFVGITGNFTLVIPIFMIILLANYGPSFISFGTQTTTLDCSEVTSSDVGPETHYWQSFLSFAFYFGCLVVPFLITLFIFLIIRWNTLGSQAFKTEQENTVFMKWKSGELLFYLNQLYKVQSLSNDSERIMELIYKVHDGREQLTMNQLQHYIQEYRDIRLSLFINTCVK